jgi:Zn-finger nucleic acid-binding protein
MQTVFYDGVAIKLCSSCKSMFLNKESLAVIEASVIEEIHKIEITTETPISQNGLEAQRDCPECQLVMDKRQHEKIGMMIDYCEQCTGIWLDKNKSASTQLSHEAAENNKISNQINQAHISQFRN